jgi:hypothetical protein
VLADGSATIAAILKAADRRRTANRSPIAVASAQERVCASRELVICEPLAGPFADRGQFCIHEAAGV